MFELAKQFRFDAAHTLSREIEAEASRRIHGHSYRAEVVVGGARDPQSGMVVDLGMLEQTLARVRDGLDHRLLDEVPELGPATLENLAMWIWRAIAPAHPGLRRVSVFRDSNGEGCTFDGQT